MSDTISTKDFLKARRDRALGSILGHMERTVWTKLSADERYAIRGVVIDALNLYHDSILDLLKSETPETERNQEVLRLLNELNDKVS